LPWTARIAEVNIDVGFQTEPSVIREFLAAIPGQRFVQFPRFRHRCIYDNSINTDRCRYILNLMLAQEVYRNIALLGCNDLDDLASRIR